MTNETQYLGGQKVLSVGDEGIIRLATWHDMVGTSGWKIKVYDAEAFQEEEVPETIADLDAVLVENDPENSIEAVNPGTIFPAAGYYILRSYVVFAGSAGVLGDPVKIYVNKGSAEV